MCKLCVSFQTWVIEVAQRLESQAVLLIVASAHLLCQEEHLEPDEEVGAAPLQAPRKPREAPWQIITPTGYAASPTGNRDRVHGSFVERRASVLEYSL